MLNLEFLKIVRIVHGNENSIAADKMNMHHAKYIMQFVQKRLGNVHLSCMSIMSRAGR